MDEATRERIKKTIKKADILLDLEGNADFQVWKQDVVQKRLNSLVEAILASDVQTDEGRNLAITNIMAYQQLKFVIDDVFKFAKATKQQSQNFLKGS